MPLSKVTHSPRGQSTSRGWSMQGYKGSAFTLKGLPSFRVSCGYSWDCCDTCISVEFLLLCPPATYTPAQGLSLRAFPSRTPAFKPPSQSLCPMDQSRQCLSSQYPRVFHHTRNSLVLQLVKNLPAMQETQVQSLGQEAPLENKMATQSSTLAWRIPWQRTWRATVHGITESRTRLCC